MRQKRRNGNRQGRRVKNEEVKQPLAVRVREFHDTVREMVQLMFYLILSGLSLGMVLVGAYELRFWLG